MTTHHPIPSTHFAKKTLRQLSKKGITITGATWIPGADGSYANGETAYELEVNGCRYLRTFLQVRKAAESTWSGEGAVIEAFCDRTAAGEV